MSESKVWFLIAKIFFATDSASSSEIADKAMYDKKRPAPMSAAERLILEEQERKRRRMERDNAV